MVERLKASQKQLQRMTRACRSFLSQPRNWLGWKNARCSFVLSTGRTGTKTLYQLYNLSPEILAYHEPPPRLTVARKEAFGQVWSQPEKFAAIFESARKHRVRRAACQKMIYAETSARLTFFAPVISDMMPNSKFIFLHRHPGDVVRSGMRRLWYQGHRMDNDRITPTPDDPVYDEWPGLDPFAKICWYWNAYNSFALRFARTMQPDRILIVPSAELFDRDTLAWDRVFKFIGVASPTPEDVARVLGSKYNAQTDREFDPFHEWTDHQRSTLAEYAGETMKALGYSDFGATGTEAVTSTISHDHENSADSCRQDRLR